MSYQDLGKVVSFKAGDTLAANVVVYLSAANTVIAAITDTSYPIGVTVDYADSGASVGVVVNGIARVKVAASVTAGELVCIATDSAGFIRGYVANTYTSAIPVLGVALETASTSGDIIPVIVQPQYAVKRA